MLKDFSIKKYLNKKPPSDNSNTTKQEILELTKIPIRENFVKEMDDGKKVMENIVGKDPLIGKLINESRPIIDKIKEHHDRPRPKILAKKMGVKMQDIELKTMKTPSYPSGHSTQAYLMSLALSDKYPNKKNKLMKAARDISYSRRVAHAHYKSDSLFGEQIGKDMYNHIKDKI
tara:strand:- start:1113 stop:1634 length:522 start_codon:yes stop_codon:yes gene_type:complete